MIPEWGPPSNSWSHLKRCISMGLSMTDEWGSHNYREEVDSLFEDTPTPYNENAMTIDIRDPSDRREDLQFAISLNHDPNDVLPDEIRENPIHLPVELPGVVP